MSEVKTKPKMMVENISCVLPQQTSRGAVFLGNVYGAQNSAILKEYGIRAVLTSSIQTEINYNATDIPFHLKIQAHDKENYNLKEHINQCINFIEESRKYTNVYVHCFAGVSRSVAIVCAYIMWKLKWNYQTTIAFVKAKRIVAKPNEGFVKQLIQIEDILTRINSNGIFETPKLEEYSQNLNPKFYTNFDPQIMKKEEKKNFKGLQNSLKSFSSAQFKSNAIQNAKPSSVMKMPSSVMKMTQHSQQNVLPKNNLNLNKVHSDLPNRNKDQLKPQYPKRQEHLQNKQANSIQATKNAVYQGNKKPNQFNYLKNFFPNDKSRLPNENNQLPNGKAHISNDKNYYLNNKSLASNERIHSESSANQKALNSSSSTKNHNFNAHIVNPIVSSYQEFGSAHNNSSRTSANSINRTSLTLQLSSKNIPNYPYQKITSQNLSLGGKKTTYQHNKIPIPKVSQNTLSTNLNNKLYRGQQIKFSEQKQFKHEYNLAPYKMDASNKYSLTGNQSPRVENIYSQKFDFRSTAPSQGFHKMSIQSKETLKSISRCLVKPKDLPGYKNYT